MQKSWFVIIAILLGVVAFSVIAITASRTMPGKMEPSSTPSNSENTEQSGTESMTMLAGSDAIFIGDQRPGTSVTVSTVVFQTAGFVVIHMSKEGRPAEVMGHSSLVTTGDYITFELDTAIVDGQEYWAMLHTDDGDGQFEFPGNDGPTKDSTGNIIMMQFVGNKDADQTPQVVF